jgi:hypothetical protein
MQAPDSKFDEIILEAIHEKRLLRFVFGGKERIAEPHDYGIKQGVVRLFCYQVGGKSSSGRLPAWRWIEVAKMSNLEILDKTFPGSRGDSSKQHHRWDKVFARVGKEK